MEINNEVKVARISVSVPGKRYLTRSFLRPFSWKILRYLPILSQKITVLADFQKTTLQTDIQLYIPIYMNQTDTYESNKKKSAHSFIVLLMLMYHRWLKVYLFGSFKVTTFQ